MKRIGAITAVLAVMLGLMTGCLEHKHDLIGWDANYDNHWQLCDDCDELVNFTLHWMDDYGYCQVCDKSIFENEDGTYSIVSYDEMGNTSKCIDYDENDEVVYEARYESEYDENGNPKHVKEYIDGVLMSESTYLPCADHEGEVYESEYIAYSEDGTKSVTTQDEQSMPLSSTEYDADGNVIATDTYEYTYDDAGNLASQICRRGGIVTGETVYALDAEGNVYVAKDVFYDDDGTFLGETMYDSEGNVIEGDGE